MTYLTVGSILRVAGARLRVVSIRKFDPAQTRDYHGRWTSTGGGMSQEEINALATTRGHPGSKKRQVYDTYKKHGVEAAQQQAQFLGVKDEDVKSWTTTWNEQGTPPGTEPFTGPKPPVAKPDTPKPDTPKPDTPKPTPPTTWNDGRAGRDKLRLVHGSGDAEHAAAVQRGIDSIPAHHQAALAEHGVSISAVKRIKMVGGAQGVHRSFPFSGNRGAMIEIGHHVRMGKYGNQKVMDPAGVAVHELGHGVDHINDWQHGRALARDVDRDAVKMSNLERQRAKYFFSNDKERFAELYRAAYTPGHQAFDMHISRAREIFASSIAKMKERLG